MSHELLKGGPNLPTPGGGSEASLAPHVVLRVRSQDCEEAPSLVSHHGNGGST